MTTEINEIDEAIESLFTREYDSSPRFARYITVPNDDGTTLSYVLLVEYLPCKPCNDDSRRINHSWGFTVYNTNVTTSLKHSFTQQHYDWSAEDAMRIGLLALNNEDIRNQLHNVTTIQ
jgi:hypothetical protein